MSTVSSCFITNSKPLNEQMTQLHKPASKPIQTISQKQTGLLFFITEQKLFFCCLGFDRVQRLEPHHLQKLVYKARVVYAHGQSPKAWQSERSTNEPSTQRQAIRTWRWNLMAFKVICSWKTFAGLSYWINNYNDSMHQALLHFIQSREATRTDLCLSCK